MFGIVCYFCILNCLTFKVVYIWLAYYFSEDNKCIKVIKNPVAYYFYFKWNFAK